MRRKRRSPAPAFRQPAPYNPVTGQFAMLGQGVDLTRVAMMQVLEEHDDYLLCRGYDPELKLFFNEIAVAKPYLLQRTPWDGRTVELPEESVTFTYTKPEEPGEGEIAVARERTAEYTVSGSSTEKIEPPYFVGDVIACAKPRTKLGDSPGGTSGADVGTAELERVISLLRTEPAAGQTQGVVIEWMDLNVAGRGWGGEPKPVWGRLTTNLDAKGSATVQPQKLNKTTKLLVDDTGQSTITVNDTSGVCFGLKGEKIQYRNAGVGGEGNPIYEAVTSGTATHKVTLTGSPSSGTQSATWGDATLTVTLEWVPGGKTLSGSIGVFYETSDAKWRPMVGDCAT